MTTIETVMIVVVEAVIVGVAEGGVEVVIVIVMTVIKDFKLLLYRLPITLIFLCGEKIHNFMLIFCKSLNCPPVFSLLGVQFFERIAQKSNIANWT